MIAYILHILACANLMHIFACWFYVGCFMCVIIDAFLAYICINICLFLLRSCMSAHMLAYSIPS